MQSFNIGAMNIMSGVVGFFSTYSSITNVLPSNMQIPQFQFQYVVGIIVVYEVSPMCSSFYRLLVVNPYCWAIFSRLPSFSCFS